ncbi:MAG: methylisocitrate lyase [Lentisphaeria bacterium]|jgi:methylisocitrate lyase|nr:methylisocitrate lyase [Lentisphaeria bacterium]MDP7741329.1 methylisocitrate lyase [Lentisphaeria bacterium]
MSAGKRFRDALAANTPLQVVGAVNAYCATMASRAGHQALYLSGAGVANASYGLPDLGMTTLDNVLEDVRRITAVTEVPLLVDIDTGWDDMGLTVREMIAAGAAAVHLEDQIAQKRCGHRPNKQIVSCDEMADRIKAAVDAKTDAAFFVIARTDAFAQEGLEKAIDRARAYVDAGADGIFAEAVQTLDDYQGFAQALEVPILANMTEFGKTPLFTKDELAAAGCGIILYPLSAFRAMNKAALNVYRQVLAAGDQKAVVDQMQTREELYDFLDYHAFEEKLDESFEG